ncbi:TPA: ribosome maturation factor RimP [Candidatus Poribacteria bacterium]|nr:ribosome maturation factor RimP [Candidatus Poribacteria bacterium]
MDQFGASVSDLVIPLLEDLGIELVDVELDDSKNGKTVRLLIHKSQGVTLGDCQQVIESTRPILDVCGLIKHSWDLEVASPGLDRPIVTKADFRRNLGRTIEIRFQSDSGEKIKKTNGVLKKVDSKKVTLQHSSDGVIQISISKVKQATAKLTW